VGALEPDRTQLETFVAALFRRADKDSFVSLRAFYEDGRKTPFRITPTSLAGGLGFLVDAAVDDARRAAQTPKRVVFCPPIATFANKDHAGEKDLLQGLALSVECDERPQEARATLERLLGPATVVVKSGGLWTAPDGSPHDKLHLHWRLTEPACGADLTKLKAARELACRLVGGDPSNNSVVHPNRWPGSWHRKAGPRLCEIETIVEREIDLDRALAILKETTVGKKASPWGAPDRPNGAGQADDGWADAAQEAAEVERRLELDEEFKKVLTGESYHPTLVPLAASLAARGAPEPVAYDVLHALLANSNPCDPERLRRRDAERMKLEDTVSSGYVKFDKSGGADAANAGAGQAASLWKEIDVNLFGVDILPPDLVDEMLPANWVDTIWTSAFAAAAPPDYVGLAAIVAGAGAIGNGRVAYRPSRWKEAAVLWGALVGPPSAHKSPAIRDVHEALTRIDKKLHAQWRLECDKLEADYEIALAQAKQKKTIKKPPKPPLAQLLYDDITLEKLTISMAGNPHGAIVFYDELASWFSSFTRYSADGDASGARAFWNKSYSAGRHKRDRVKSEGPPIVIEAAACSVLGGIQPERLLRFWRETNDGMLARLMLVWPRLATIKLDGGSQPMDDVSATLSRAYQALYDLKPERKTVNRIRRRFRWRPRRNRCSTPPISNARKRREKSAGSWRNG
jgi:hypothetical protein